MKSFLRVAIALLPIGVFAQKIPAISKTEFSKEAVAQKISSLQGKKIAVSEIIKKHKGRVLIVSKHFLPPKF